MEFIVLLTPELMIWRPRNEYKVFVSKSDSMIIAVASGPDHVYGHVSRTHSGVNCNN